MAEARGIGWATPLRRARLGLVIFILFGLPLVMSPLSQQYPKLIFAFVSVSLLLLVWAAELLLDKGAALHVPVAFWLGLLLLEAALISLANSENLRVGLESLGLVIVFLLLYLVLVNTVRQERTALVLLGSVFAAAVLASLYGIVQYCGFDLVIRQRVRPGIGSIISTMGNKNYLGGFLAYLYIPYGLLLLRAPRRWQKLPILLGMALIWYAIMAIASRAVWIGLAIGAIFLLAGALRLKLLRLELVRRSWRWIVGLIGLMAVITALFLFPNPLNLSGTIFGRVATGVEALAGPYVRYYDWWVTWEMIKAHPIIGIGLGDFKLEFLDYKAAFLETPRGARYKDIYIAQALQAHNDYLQMWAELGTLGAVVIGALIFLVFFSGWRRARGLSRSLPPKGKGQTEEGKERALTILLLLAGVLAFMGDAFFSFPLHWPASALCLIVLLALLDAGYLQGWAQEGRPQRYSRWALALCTAVLALTVIVFAAGDFIGDLYATRGKSLYERGDAASAKEYLEKSLEWDFAPKEALSYLGLIYTKEGEYRRAREVLERSWASYPRVTTLFNLGIAALGLRDLEEATRYLDLVTKIDPTDLDYLYQKAEIYLLTGRAEEGVEILEAIIAKDSSYYRAMTRLGKHLAENGKPDEARAQYERALVAVKRKAEGLLEQLRRPLLEKSEYDRLKAEVDKLTRDKEAIEAALQALRGQTEAPAPSP
ncbi:MAG: O-antigen ligase family protein [Candidatus Acetothermia bacterium]|nr:O-antigen ligase family protein [Candidatus Acetothermia bacterium]